MFLYEHIISFYRLQQIISQKDRHQAALVSPGSLFAREKRLLARVGLGGVARHRCFYSNFSRPAAAAGRGIIGQRQSYFYNVHQHTVYLQSVSHIRNARKRTTQRNALTHVRPTQLSFEITLVHSFLIRVYHVNSVLCFNLHS